MSSGNNCPADRRDTEDWNDGLSTNAKGSSRNVVAFLILTQPRLGSLVRQLPLRHPYSCVSGPNKPTDTDLLSWTWMEGVYHLCTIWNKQTFAHVSPGVGDNSLMNQSSLSNTQTVEEKFQVNN